MPFPTLTSLTSLTLISVPYHVGLRASPIHRSRVSEGPDYLKSAGLLSLLLSYGQQHNLPLPLPVHQLEIPPVEDTFEGEIGRTFELIRRVSLAVTAARDAASFPIVLAGNCCISVGVAAGLCGSRELLMGREDGGDGDGLGCVWFDAHDDYNVPDSMISGYFDSQGIAMLAGECWRGLMATVPGFRPWLLRRVVHCGMRDVNEVERERVEGSAVLVHLDVDVFDASLGKANPFACAGGLFEEDITGCMAAISERTIPLAFTIASFDPLCDGDESAQRLAKLSVKAVEGVLDGLRRRGLFRSSEQ
ncbi:hypothetical protein F5144DRAFT_605198 [Chaetomium tenue]|uniref:Uncharacterized protein n=1 Tax=Chaetomium tenue TaxID=1854479 RepID=A0ACB7NYC6_9PEZI|nr:hypothetical protein F5144DRAFT_605198 [Chaetomium globosum]